MKNKKKILLVVAMMTTLLVLTGCGTGDITAQSTGIWERYIVFNFGRAIKALSFGSNAGIGIILFTIIVRVILLPLMHYQNKSMRKTQEIQPKIKALQVKYASKDPDTKRKLQEEQQRLYNEHGVNPFAGCLPLLVQMPILMALWQSISRIQGLSSGRFLWLELGSPDPYFILPILAAIFTFISTKLSSMSQIESNPTMKMMTYFMPAMILFMGINLASGLSLYWVVSNAFQVGQTLVINNPFKIKREREAVAKQQRDLERALQKAQSPKKKRNKK
ncbi:YidC/Oxa1 family membrane protein insertase [Vagococcus intermedius]|uniref:Membrane protein insertase YidC n=2 Tax=Vagococcus intermedius TaxID=2991418 RepID=A0AAF0CUM4_9ENTE|nr:membrane protein insertase YidC [Vagococcus intermedius]WEG73330.1 YidC/Oxa1 family membrane protein insertase [Vagococcus intermedius]WEG75410.1 YidC/Oxa1 family membrane protein insertase [Vagococcus intermedius]